MYKRQLQERGLLEARGKQRTDSTRVLAAVRMLNRLERVGETLRAALNAVATVVPAWVQSWIPADWIERYGPRVDNYRFPKAESTRTTVANQIGTDGALLLAQIDTAAVSYTHLDVYKRQVYAPRLSSHRIRCRVMRGSLMTHVPADALFRQAVGAPMVRRTGLRICVLRLAWR